MATNEVRRFRFSEEGKFNYNVAFYSGKSTHKFMRKTEKIPGCAGHQGMR
jgi:hypothetical protein